MGSRQPEKARRRTMKQAKAAVQPLKQIRFVRKHEIVYEELKLAVMTGQFEPGKRLKLRELAAALGTSPMPVRDSLKRLVAEQALEQTDSGQVSIPFITRQLFQELMEARALNEGEAAARAALRMPQSELPRLNRLAQDLNAATHSGDILRYLKLNQSMKFGIYAHCGSSVLIGLIETLWLRAGPFLRHLARDLEGLIAINDHAEALAAIAAGNGEGSRRAIMRDILSGMEFLLAHAQFCDDADV
jgi:DNA-binding GntR family transcriptional regulator